ncbi:hypothetical protein [Klebsiella pneumoniae IS53]|nr:hypothetical protein HMPREF9538_02708 [Klebsiella sp. MS 92-3]CDL23517.1 hypothetical protein [Klebsiella pneumoniae IS53]
MGEKKPGLCDSLSRSFVGLVNSIPLTHIMRHISASVWGRC